MNNHMAKVLYITANPKAVNESYGLSVGDAFLKTYRESNPNDEITHLDLFDTYVPFIDNDVMTAWGVLAQGKQFTELTADQQKKVGRLAELCDQFVAHDKYVFVVPLWNFSVPPVMKAYIDSIASAGKTFKYTEQGPVGLLTDKKALIIQASGGVHSEGPTASWEHGASLLKVIMTFFGVPSIETLYVEGMAAQPDKAESIKQAAIEKATALAKNF
jgi:FMN-dependent NADH-azoreductase